MHSFRVLSSAATDPLKTLHRCKRIVSHLTGQQTAAANTRGARVLSQPLGEKVIQGNMPLVNSENIHLERKYREMIPGDLSKSLRGRTEIW